MWHGSWRFVVSLATALAMSVTSNLQSQSTPAIDPFDARPTSKRPPTTTAVELEATEIEAAKLNRIQAILRRRHDEGMFVESQMKKRLDMIRTYPELGRHLVKIADRMIEQRSPEIGDVLDAMSMRADVPPEATARYIELTKSIIEGKTAKDINDGFEKEYVSGIANVLAAHISPENEDLLIKLLWFDPYSNTYKVLGRAGTSRALPAMQKYADDYEKHARSRGNASAYYSLKEIKGSLVELSKRVSGAEQRGGPTIQQEVAKNSKIVQRTAGNGTENMRASQEWNIIMIVTAASVLIGVGCGLLWLLLKNRK